MSEDNLNWIPQVKSNDISIEKTNRVKPTLSTKLSLKYISIKKDNFTRLMLYFRVLDPDSLNIVNEDMQQKSITQTNLPFWYNTDDEEYILKVSLQNCKFDMNFEKNQEYNIDVEFRRYSTKKNHGYTCVLHNIIADDLTNNIDD